MSGQGNNKREPGSKRVTGSTLLSYDLSPPRHLSSIVAICCLVFVPIHSMRSLPAVHFSRVREADGAVRAPGGAGCRQGRGAGLPDPPRPGLHWAHAAEEAEGLQRRLADARRSGQVGVSYPRKQRVSRKKRLVCTELPGNDVTKGRMIAPVPSSVFTVQGRGDKNGPKRFSDPSSLVQFFGILLVAVARRAT